MSSQFGHAPQGGGFGIGSADRYNDTSKAPSGPSFMSTIESSAMKLLVSTKQLLEALTRWARGEATEHTVSDIYVTLGNEFNVVCRAFLSVGIETSDLGDVPQALRVILEKALSENASQETLDQYLPSIQEIIVNMLRRLKQKQAIMRSASAQRKIPLQPQYAPTVPTHGNTGSGSSGVAAPSHINQSSVSSSGSSSQSYTNNQGSGPYQAQRKYPTRSESLSSISSRQNSQTSDFGQQQQSTIPSHQNQLSQSHPLPHHYQSPQPQPQPPQLQSYAQSQPQPKRTAGKDAMAKSYSSGSPMSRKEYLRAQAQTRTASSPHGGADNALVALQKSEALERRASRRFSAFQFAKLASGVSTSELPPLPTTPEYQHSPYLPTTGSHSSTLPDYTTSTNTVGYGAGEPNHTGKNSMDNSLGDISVNKSIPGTPEETGDIVLFLQLGVRTKKITTNPNELTISSLRLKFIDTFGFTLTSDVIPELYVTDPKTHIKYELDELAMADVRAGSVLVSMDSEPVTPETPAESADLQRLETMLTARMDELCQMFARFDQAKQNEDNARTSQVSQASQKSGDTDKDRTSSSSAGTPTSVPAADAGVVRADKAVVAKAIRQVQSVEKDVAAVRQLSTQALKPIKEQMKLLHEKMTELKNVAIVQNTSTSRGYMESCQKKLSDDSDILLTTADEIQDVVEGLSKDVVIRRVRPSPRQVEAVSKDIRAAQKRLEEMDAYTKREKEGWQKIWEHELESICEEQQFLKHQLELAEDLRNDLKSAQETLSLVEACLEQQNKEGANRHMVATTINPAPADGLTHIKDRVMSEVSALQPNHEQRVEAIERAEKMRKRELEIRLGGEFQEELGEFVSENKLKPSGGIEEAERQRKIREQKVLEEQAKTDLIVQEQRAEERKKKKKEKASDTDKDKKEKKKKKKRDKEKRKSGQGEPEKEHDSSIETGEQEQQETISRSTSDIGDDNQLLERPPTPGDGDEFDTAEEESSAGIGASMP